MNKDRIPGMLNLVLEQIAKDTKKSSTDEEIRENALKIIKNAGRFVLISEDDQKNWRLDIHDTGPKDLTYVFRLLRQTLGALEAIDDTE